MPLHRLNASFAALYATLEVPRIARRTVFGLLVVHSILLAYSAYVHSPTLNEPGHLVAGLSHWKFGRFELFRVNPPLVRMVAALPVMAAGYEEDWSGFHEGPGARPAFGMGEAFVAANGERSFFLFMIARWACMPFSWIGAIVCYLWARDLYGRPAGVLACTIWCFEPNILAHASLITADAPATALGLAACYTFWRWLKRPTWTQAAVTGVVLGLAELCKTTLILFYPLWPLMWVVYRLAGSGSFFARADDDPPTDPDAKKVPDPLPARMTPRDWLREAGMLVLRMAIGLYVLNLGYGFEGSLKPLNEFHFVSDLFAGRETRDEGQEPNDGATSPQPVAPSPPSINRFADTWLGELPVPFPKNYLLGIDIQQRDFEHYGRPSYLRGQWQDHGWWYYYLYAVAIKVPLGLWLLGVFVLVSRKSRVFARYSEPGRPRPRHLRDDFILLFPAFFIFAVVSSKTGFNEHMRYVLPVFPYFFIAVSQVAQTFWSASKKTSPSCLTTAPPNGYVASGDKGARSFKHSERRMAFLTTLSAATVALLGSWLIASSLWIYPHSLSYFNESIAGPLNGPKHLLGSNVDWGQDLYILTKLAGHIPSEKLCISTNALYDGRDLGIRCAVWDGSTVCKLRQHFDAQRFADLPEGFYVVGVDRLLALGAGWTDCPVSSTRFFASVRLDSSSRLTPGLFLFEIRHEGK